MRIAASAEAVLQRSAGGAVHSAVKDRETVRKKLEAALQTKSGTFDALLIGTPG